MQTMRHAALSVEAFRDDQVERVIVVLVKAKDSKGDQIGKLYQP
jgi:peptide deformylase